MKLLLHLSPTAAPHLPVQRRHKRVCQLAAAQRRHRECAPKGSDPCDGLHATCGLPRRHVGLPRGSRLQAGAFNCSAPRYSGGTGWQGSLGEAAVKGCPTPGKPAPLREPPPRP